MWVWGWVLASASEPDATEATPVESAPPTATPVPAMRGHFEKATTAMLATALGQMKEASDAARALADTSGVPPTLAEAATELQRCGRLPCATERVAAMARTCAECHLETGHGPRPRNLTSLPGATARERHMYAATFAWVGLVTPKQPLFLFGLANVVPPVDSTSTDKHLVEVRDTFRAAQQAAVTAETLEARSDAFAHLLEACAGCHDLMGVPAK